MHFSRKKISRKKILNQIIAGNVAIAVSTIVVVAIIAMSTSTHYLNKKFINGNRLQMEYNVAQTESELERIVKIPFAVNSQNQNIQQLFKLAYSGDVLGFSTSFSEFVGLYADYSNVDSIWIYDGKYTIIDTKSGLKQVSNFEEWKRMTELRYQAANNYTYMTPYISEMNTERSYHNVISIVSPLNMSDSSYQSGCVIINVNMSNIVNSVSGNGDGKGNFFIINPKNNTEIIIRRQNLFSDNDIQNILNVKENGNVYVNGEKFDVCIKESRVIPKYMYVLAVSYSGISSEKNGVYLKYIYVVLCLILIEIIIILIISKYIYQPFETIFSNVNLIFSKEMGNGEKDSFDELAMLNEYMTNLQEKLNSKSKKLDDYFSIIRQNAGQRIIDGDWNDEAGINKILEECGVIFKSESYIICLFMIDNWLETIRSSKEESVAVKNTVFAVIESVFFNDFNCICNIPQNDRVIFIIEDDNDDTESRIDKAFDSVNDILRLQSDKTISMARITGITSITNISAGCVRLSELAEERFNCGRKANIKKAADKFGTKEAQKCYMIFMNNIKKAIAERNLESTSEAVKIFADNMKCMPSEYIKAIILRFIYSIKSEYRVTEEADYIQNNITDIVKYSTADDLGAQLLRILNNIILSIIENPNDNVSFKIKEYIDNNLNKDLSLMSLGDVFKLTPSYLSTLFKNVHGIGVVDYINKSRIEKAKLLLKNTNMTIKDISDEVGFMNYNSFARVFKKYVGISANDFKHEVDLQNENSN